MLSVEVREVIVQVDDDEQEPEYAVQCLLKCIKIVKRLKYLCGVSGILIEFSYGEPTITVEWQYRQQDVSDEIDKQFEKHFGTIANDVMEFECRGFRD